MKLKTGSAQLIFPASDLRNGFQIRRSNSPKGLLALVAIIAFALAAWPGCMAGTGKLKEDPILTKTFREKGILPDYNYYYTGRSNLPYAVIGIKPEYRLETNYWTQIPKDQVHDKVSRVMLWDDFYSRGSTILDPSGRQIGIWFSYYRQTVVKFKPGNTVNVFSPYLPFDDPSDAGNPPGS